MIAVLMPFNTKLLQVKHLLVLWGLITLGRCCGKDFHSTGLSFCFRDLRNKNRKTPNLHREKINSYYWQVRASIFLDTNPLFIHLLIMISLIEVTSLLSRLFIILSRPCLDITLSWSLLQSPLTQIAINSFTCLIMYSIKLSNYLLKLGVININKT